MTNEENRGKIKNQRKKTAKTPTIEKGVLKPEPPEKLQSVNEKIEPVNAELRKKIEELDADKCEGSRVLVIEDNADSAETLKILLEMNGYQVEIASDGKHGIEKAAGFAPAIVICDIGLPGGISGYDVAGRLKADGRYKSVYFIALSGYGQSEDKKKSAAAGFHEHLVKPVDFDVLTELLGKISNK